MRTKRKLSLPLAYSILIYFLFSNFYTHAQIKKIGQPFMKNYGINDYLAETQNWDIYQDKRGIIFIGNTGGVLEFDGLEWKKHVLDNGLVARRISKDEKGRILVGGSSQIGYLATDSLGEIYFKSLLQIIPPQYHDFRDVYFFDYREGKYTCLTSKYLFIGKDENIKVFNVSDASNYVGQINGENIFFMPSKGLFKLQSDELVLLKNTKIFSDKKVRSILKLENNEHLIITQSDGFYKYLNDGSIETMPEKLNSTIKKYLVYSAVRIHSNEFAIGTHGQGIIIFDKNLNIIKTIDSKSGLSGNTVYRLYVDKGYNLWACLNKGVSFIEINSSYTQFRHEILSDNEIYITTIFNNRLYIGGEPYLFSAKWQASELFDIRKADLVPTTMWDFYEYHNQLFCGSSSGISVFDSLHQQKNIILNSPNSSVWSFDSVPNGKEQLIAATNTNLYVLEKKLGQWKIKNTIKGINHFFRIAKFDHEGYFWTASIDKGLCRIKFNSGLDSVINIEYYNENNGLPSRYNLFLTIRKSHFVAFCEGKLFKFNFENKKFEPLQLKKPFSWLYGWNWAGNNELWAYTNKGVQILKFTLGGIRQITDKYNKYGQLNAFTGFCFSKEGDVFLSSLNNIQHIDTAFHKKKYTFRTLIRKVKLLQNDSLLFMGNLPLNSEKLDTIDNYTFPNRISNKLNSIRFVFSSMFYEEHAKNLYSTKLVGFENTWSNWNSETSKDYTNLNKGSYVFMVKSKNIYGWESSTSTFKFSIAPPWYKTILAYVFYSFALLVLIIISLISFRKRVRMKYLRKEKDLKINLYTNISHEIKTPLTLIISPLQEIITRNNKTGHDNSVFMLMFRNAKRLENLVNQMLDFRNLESGKLNPVFESTDVVLFCKDIYTTFSYLSRQNNINYTFRSDLRRFEFPIYRDIVETIMNNLISNAFKFTKPGKDIAICIQCQNKDELSILNRFDLIDPMIKIGNIQNQDYFIIDIEDKGIGIGKDNINHIFTQFYQEKKKSYISTKGSGIGLFYCKELVLLYNGEFCVWSIENEGSLFRLKIPIPPEQDNEQLYNFQAIRGTDQENKVDTLEKEFTILLVDNDVDFLNFMHSILVDEYKIIKTHISKFVLDLALQKQPDLILTDLEMPELSGFELCKMIKENAFTSHIPVMIITAYNAEEYKSKGFENGANMFIQKPFDPGFLKTSIHNLLETQKKKIDQINLKESDDGKNLNGKNNETDFVQIVKDLITKNISDPDFSIDQLAQDLNMSRSVMFRRFKEHMDITPNEYIQIIRIKRSASLFKEQDLTVSEVAYMVGFKDPKYFSTCFKRHYKQTPMEFKQSF